MYLPSKAKNQALFSIRREDLGKRCIRHARPFSPFLFDAYFPHRVSKLMFFSVVNPRGLSLLPRPIPFLSIPFFESYSDPIGLAYERENAP